MSPLPAEPGLTARQHRAVLAMLTCRSTAAAARSAGVGYQTLIG